MKQHLRDDEYSSMLAGSSRADWLRHLEECAPCERRFTAEKLRIERIRETLMVAGTRPETYWTVRHARIMSALQSSRRALFPMRWRVAAGAMALVVFSLVLLRPHPYESAQPPQSQADEQLLMEAEQVANSDVPDAMAPADLLAEDMELHANTFETRVHVQKTGTGGRRW